MYSKLTFLLLAVTLLCSCTATAAASAGESHSHPSEQHQKTSRRLMQYRETAFANPAVGLVNDAMATGQAPSDIAAVRGRGWVRGKVMGQRIDADGVATASIGNNPYGGVTAVGDAYGQFETSGRYGYAAGQGQARAAAATTLESAYNGYTVMNGAAAAQASGQVYGALPSGQNFYARGSASAQAEGTIMYAS